MCVCESESVCVCERVRVSRIVNILNIPIYM